MKNSTDLIIYTTDKNIDIKFNKFEDDIWLTQKQIAVLFGVSRATIEEHLRNSFNSHELDKNQTCRNFLQVQKEGKKEVSRDVLHYNLKAITFVGFRVKSKQAKVFQDWTTDIIRDYSLKGFVFNENILSNSLDSLNKASNRIDELRASESNLQQICNEMMSLSVDYDKNSPIVSHFFASVQNKLLYAVSNKTAGEIIVSRANGNIKNMGLQTWKETNIRKSDTTVGKNYLLEDELMSLHSLVSIFYNTAKLDYRRGRLSHMKDWDNKINSMLEFNGFEILKDGGNVSTTNSHKHAHNQYEIFNNNRKLIAQ